ncbi:hypothetical protein AN958_08926 [Leucoagaricus sp. SymC.cos]|nr:hypothetical protein AN958_08926 [Leucoagaricus sp. SymC.cos]
MSLRTTCPYCHQTKTDETIPSISPQSSADAIAYIQAETQRIDDLITKLHEDRSALLRRLNAIQPATRVLFPEMLSLIFQQACPTPDHFQQQTVQKRQEFEDEDGYLKFHPGYQEDPHFHPTLASVSSQWRDIVHSTPSLWSSIQIQGARKRDAGKWALFLKNSFERSRDLPLDIALDRLDSSWAENGHIFSTEFDDTLQRNSRRIRSMFVRGYISQECFSMAETLPNVVDLVFEDLFMIIPGSIPELSFPLNPPLRRLHLDILNMNTNFDGVVTSLTALNLFRTPIDVCMKLLISCPELVEFRCCSSLRPKRVPKRVHASSALSSQISLSRLELLEWRFERVDHAKPWSRDLLTYINTPALRTLRWVQGSDFSPRRYADLIPGFLVRLPLTLETLEFVDVGLTPVESLPTNHIRNDTHVKSIVPQGCH